MAGFQQGSKLISFDERACAHFIERRRSGERL